MITLLIIVLQVLDIIDISMWWLLLTLWIDLDMLS